MYSKFLQVSKEIGVPINKILDVFFYLKDGKPIENNELIRKVGVSRNTLNQVKKRFSLLLRSSSKNTQLKPTVVQEVAALFKSNYQAEEHLLLSLDNKDSREIKKLLGKYEGLRPLPKREYDQFTATAETTAKRASLLNFLGDVQGKHLFFLGDDDFTSVAVASLGTAEEIVVLDIDRRVLKNINTISEKEGLNIKVDYYDARSSLSRNFLGKFDVVFTDPPYTKNGMSLFVSRAIEALNKKNQAVRVYVCYGNSDRAKERFLPLYQTFVDSGLMIRWVFDKFNRYHGAESIGSASSLFVCEVTAKMKPIVRGKYVKSIYTFD
jgi:predicted methyltransferase